MNDVNQQPQPEPLQRNARKAPSATIDANEAVARIAYKTNEVCIIYPITPASAMGEHTDA